MDYQIFPPEEIVDAVIKLPLSKSISNRVLLINALTGNKGHVEAVAQCDDTEAMTSGLASSGDSVNVGAAGTAMRFLTAYFAGQAGRKVTLDGSERMRQRPIRPLVDALLACGARISYSGTEGFPPIAIEGCHLKGGDVTVDASVSSQYVSALLMMAPAMEQGLNLTLSGNAVSRPYIAMTVALMKQWGAQVEIDDNVITVAPGAYKPVDCKVEADWSAASYWYEIAAFSFGDIKLVGLDADSTQGDSALMKIYRNFGIESTRDADGNIMLEASPDITPRMTIDMSGQPDLAQTVAVTCCVLNLPFMMSGLSTLKDKETDRIEALVTELAKLSFILETPERGTLVWEGKRMPVQNGPVAIDTYKDHRMAMAFAPIALFLPGIIIKDADVVNKSYPEFWDHLRQVGFTLNSIDLEAVEDVSTTPAD